MNEPISNTIEVLAQRVRVKEDEAAKLKRLVNELCSEGGLPLRYADITILGDEPLRIRGDQFYGLAITTAIRNYLEMRKAANQGPATVSEIYEAIKSGGYKFETENEENAKTTVRNNLRKSSSIFHRLPNGDFGLLIWYPNAKPPKPEEPQAAGTEEPPALPPTPEKKNNVTHGEIKEVISGINGNFQASDVEKLVRQRFPSKVLPAGAISTVLYWLKNTKRSLKMVSERQGAKGAVYSKV